MKTALRYALLLTLLSIFCLDASAARKRPRKRAKKNAAEAVAPDTVYIIKYVQPVDTAEVPQRPKFGERGCTDYSPEVRDSLLSGWYRRNVVASYDDFFDRYVSEDTTANGSEDATPDSVYARRLQQARIARPTPLQPYRPRLHRPLHQSPLRYDQPYSGVVAILFPADRGGGDQGRAPRRTAGAADHRIGAQPDGRVAHGRRRFMAIHAFDRKTLRTGSQLAHRRTLRSRAGDPRRLPLPQRHVRRLRRLDAGDRLLQLRAGERQQGHRPFGRRQDLLGDLRLPAA